MKNLSYGEALVELCSHVTFRTEETRDAVRKAIEVEHGLYVVPEAEKLADELERLRALAKAQREEKQAAADAAELASLRDELGLTRAADDQADDDQGDEEDEPSF